METLFENFVKLKTGSTKKTLPSGTQAEFSEDEIDASYSEDNDKGVGDAKGNDTPGLVCR